MDGPVVRRSFGAGEDFFSEHVNRPPVRRQANSKRLRTTLLEFFEIFARQVQSIGMINAEPRQRPTAQQIEWQAMNRIENFWQFNANRRQIIHVEKAAIIDL